MELSIPRPQPRTDGDYETFVDCGYGKPWAIIHLAVNGTLDLREIDVDDCDRLIKAAVEVKTRLIAYQAEIAAPHDRRRVYQGTCQLCGKPEDDALHAVCAAVAEHTGVSCSLAPHVGGRHESAGHIVWGPGVTEPDAAAPARCHRHPERPYGACPECSAEIDASIARKGEPLSAGEIAELDAAAAADAVAHCPRHPGEPYDTCPCNVVDTEEGKALDAALDADPDEGPLCASLACGHGRLVHYMGHRMMGPILHCTVGDCPCGAFTEASASVAP